MIHHPDASPSSHDLREAVAQIAARLIDLSTNATKQETTYTCSVITRSIAEDARDLLRSIDTGPIAAELARLTGHAEAGHANADANYRRLQEAEEKIARLTGERDEAVAAWHELDGICDETLDRARAAEAELATLKADISAAEARGRAAGLDAALTLIEGERAKWGWLGNQGLDAVKADIAALANTPPGTTSSAS